MTEKTAPRRPPRRASPRAEPAVEARDRVPNLFPVAGLAGGGGRLPSREATSLRKGAARGGTING